MQEYAQLEGRSDSGFDTLVVVNVLHPRTDVCCRFRDFNLDKTPLF